MKLKIKNFWETEIFTFLGFTVVQKASRICQSLDLVPTASKQKRYYTSIFFYCQGKINPIP